MTIQEALLKNDRELVALFQTKDGIFGLRIATHPLNEGFMPEFFQADRKRFESFIGGQGRFVLGQIKLFKTPTGAARFLRKQLESRAEIALLFAPE